VSFTLGPGVIAAIFAVVAMLVLSAPALGSSSSAWRRCCSRVLRKSGCRCAERSQSQSKDAVPAVRGAVAVGWFARSSTLTANLLRHANVAMTIVTSTIASLVINNLPAASLFAAHGIAHPFALLLGLDLGPNCAVTGALSSLLWWRIARTHQMRPSLVTFSVVGTIVALIAMAAAAPLL